MPIPRKPFFLCMIVQLCSVQNFRKLNVFLRNAFFAERMAFENNFRNNIMFASERRLQIAL